MGIRERFLNFVGERYFERPARRLPLRDHVQRLRDSGEALQRRVRALPGTGRDREMLRHVIGIERWGQRRLRVFGGEAFVLDGHQTYMPAADAPWERLVEEFNRTRAETLRLAEGLTDCNTVGTVPHNDFGDLSARGWLRYLDGHAVRGIARLR